MNLKNSLIKVHIFPVLILLLLISNIAVMNAETEPTKEVPAPAPLAHAPNTLKNTLKVQGNVYGDNLIEAMRPVIIGRNGVVSTGRYLASMVGYDILRKGGNAFDAGVAAAAALCVQKMYAAG